MREFKITGFAQGTTYSINYFADDSLVTRNQIDSILNVIDLSMSLYKPNSTISKFNKMPMGKIKIDTHMKNVLVKSFQINKETDGLFDITLQPLMRLWGFYKDGANQTPDTSRIKAFLSETIGMNKIKLRKDFLSKANNHIEIDLNGIAQGYSVDVIADFFETKGINIYVVEVGGEVSAKGPKPDGKPIKIGIEGPSENAFTDANIKHIISFTQGAITTSGNYRKFITYNGKNYGHIISPKTGYPINNEVISVTVFAKKAIDADGYDNALMLMGIEKALKFVEQKKDIEAYFIYKKPDGKVVDTLTSGFKKMIVDNL
ncbi:FAD:protein FMN transferase [Pedobacter frigiditerrae]|uniref:FAD:protein FMN transferase n=1 Tax=Pedobacter frigiditerrae TaxID=2530452 RepID=UPI001CECEEC9|nr:FAD:protein FMN transferase [Pedobacter frigiditerrae]